LDYFDKVLKIDPNHVKALETKASVLKGLERNEEAIESINAAIKIDPQNYHILTTKSLFLLSLGKMRKLWNAQMKH